ncbi:hypothetical protein B0T10DRAFT_416344 [Thelonectria olida]|uniref:Uncharacterized protein n=1 Tax=Thelonectria olida TaxID=1576542 RepID=A0A9P8VUL1_9HYPO|nr:hypothetical protein B0T10DRAFT_416344 [Thelonectria olida]
MGKAPYLTQVRKGGHGLGNTYHERLQGLFGWDDDIDRTLWDHCYYRQLARRFHTSISTHISDVEAEDWKSTLGKHALPHFWVIPHYSRHSLFTRLPKTAKRPAVTRPFISGLHQWRVRDVDDRMTANEERWLLGGNMYQSGHPENIFRRGEAETDATEGQLRSYVIDFGCAVPFTGIPLLIEEGFEACRKSFAQGDQKILAHYEAARDCLIRGLGDPLCDLLLMIVLTFSSSTDTPVLPMYGHNFEAGPRRDQRLLAVALTTRMLWFLYPDSFPWEEDGGMVLSIPEMTKKMGKCLTLVDPEVSVAYARVEHKGVNNRILCKLGWVHRYSAVRGFRETPRNSELTLRSEKELLEFRAELLSLMNNPPDFIARVFQSKDDIWAERCFGLFL